MLLRSSLFAALALSACVRVPPSTDDTPLDSPEFEDADTTDTTTGDTTDDSAVDTPAEPTPEERVPVETTIEELQTDQIGKKMLVTIRDVVVTGIERTNKAIYVQDPTLLENGGIQIWVNRDADRFTLGDILTITGDFDQPHGMARIGNHPVIEITGSTEMPSALDLTLGELADDDTAELYEGMRIRISGDLIADDMRPDDNDFGEWILSDGSSFLRVDDNFMDIKAELPELAEGDTFTAIVGVLGYSFNNFKLWPLDINDFEGYGPAAE